MFEDTIKMTCYRKINSGNLPYIHGKFYYEADLVDEAIDLLYNKIQEQEKQIETLKKF